MQEEVIVTPGKVINKFGIDVYEADLRTLDGFNWLNDTIIEFYLKLVAEESQTYAAPLILFKNLDSWLKRLEAEDEKRKKDEKEKREKEEEEKKKKKGVKPKVEPKVEPSFNPPVDPNDPTLKRIVRYTTKAKITSFEYVLVPINPYKHWSLVFIDVKNKTFNYYDSIKDSNRSDRVNYLMRVWCQVETTLKSTHHDFHVVDCAQQKNTHDCGVFACQFAKYLVSKQNVEDVIQENMQFFRKQMKEEIRNGKLETIP